MSQQFVPRPPHHAAQDRYLDLLDDSAPWGRAIVGLQDAITTATIDFWRERQAKAVHLPTTTSAVSSPMGLGSDSHPVPVDLFGVRTYLADSMQFMLEYACRLTDRGSYYLLPSFRGEATDESHLAQFFHSEAEIVGGLDDIIATVDDYILALCRAALESCAEEISTVAGTADHVTSLLEGPKSFARMTFDEVASELQGVSGAIVEHQAPGGATWRTISRLGELELLRRTGAPLWVTHYDHLSVPFYQGFGPHGSALNADLLLGIGEVVGCGERHVGSGPLVAALDLHQVATEDYAWYVAMHERFPRTAGFGMGVERLMAWLLQHWDVRDLQLLPRENGVALIP
jgi:asparaginyl-tRNA synthetase